MPVGLCLGLNICQPHPCPCGTQVDARGMHGLSCKLSSGRMTRHYRLKDLIRQALSRAGIPSSKEPSGLSTSDSKRPDGMTLIPWQAGRNLLWDILDILAASHLPSPLIFLLFAAPTSALLTVSVYLTRNIHLRHWFTHAFIVLISLILIFHNALSPLSSLYFTCI